MFGFFKKKKLPNETSINTLITHVTKTNAVFTLQTDNKGFIYRILNKNGGVFDFEKANKDLKRYIRDVEDKVEVNFDKSTALVFAKISNTGDKYQHLFTDKSKRIFHADFDNGWSPKFSIVGNSIEFLLGKIDLEKLSENDYHFQFPHPIHRAVDLIDAARIVTIFPHGFMIDDYNLLLTNLFKPYPEFELDYFKYNRDYFMNKGVGQYEAKLSINQTEFTMIINKSKWFDLKITEYINPILRSLASDKIVVVIQEEDWDEKYAICLLTQDESEKFRSQRLVL